MSMATSAESDRTPSSDLDLRYLLLMIWRHKFLLLLITVVITTLSYLYINHLVPRYTADAVIVLDIRRANVGIDPVVSELRTDETVVRSEVDVLRSRWLARRVVENLQLARDPEFNPRLRPHKPGLLEGLATIDWIPDALQRWLAAAPLDANVEDASGDLPPSAVSTVINGVLANLTVVNDGRSYTVELSFESEDPEKAARIVNAFAEHYLAGQQESKFDAAERGAEWLEKKAAELRDRVRRAEAAVLEYRKSNSLIDLGEEGFLAKRMATLADELIATRTDRIRMETRLNEVRRTAAAAAEGSVAPAITDSPVLEKRLEEVRAAEAELIQLRSTFGENHPLIAQTKSELDQLRAQFQEEIDRQIASLRRDARWMAAQEISFAAMLDELEAQNLEAYWSKVELQQLVSEAGAARSLLDTFLASLDRTSMQLDLVQPDARTLSFAEPPTWPSFPQRRILLGLAVIGSLMIGFAVVLMLEFMHRGFRAAVQIEHAFGIPVVGMVPLIKSRGVGKRHPSSYALARPLSTFAESVRLVRTAIQSAMGDRPPRVMMVTSAVPDEGKTTLALTLGRLGAAAGHRTLLIDCDLRVPSVASDLGTTSGQGLAQVLAGEATIKDVLRFDQQSGLYYIPAGRRSPDAIELLSSERMRELVAAAVQISDTVILDSPPVTVVSDPIVLSRLADTVLMVVRWDHTSRSLVAAAIKRLTAAKAPLAGVVLSRVDMARHASYGVGDFPHGYLKGYLSS